MTELILLAHGSPDPRSGEAILEFAERIHRRLDLRINVAYLDHQRPSLADLAQQDPGEDVLVVPLLLSNAFHARFDVPKVMAESGFRHVMAPIGHPIKVLTELIKTGGPNVIVVSAGNSNVAERRLFQDAVDLACLGSGTSALSAFVSGSELNIDAQLAVIAKSIKSIPTIIPWLLAPGRLLDSVIEQAEHSGARVEGSGLVKEPSFFEHICTSIQKFLLSEFYPGLARVQ